MAINVSQAFRRTSANPVDESMALTKAQMKTVNDNLMPAYYFTICQDDGEIYLYDKTATASAETGKFTKFEGGGGSGGGSTLVINKTLTAAGWNNKQQSLTFTGYDSDLGGVIGMPTNATAAQKEAYKNAEINVTAQNGAVFTFSCENVPSVDLPVTLYAGGGSGGGGTADFPAGGTTGQALVKKSNADNDVEWKNISGEGHTIQDNSGTDLPQRENLKIVGASVIDDSENNSTIITIDLDDKTDKVQNATNNNLAGLDASGNLKDSGIAPADISGKENKFRYDTMPEASAEAVALGMVQYIGTTLTNSFKHGMFYECKAQGTDPETYAWEEVPTELKELTQSQYNVLSPAERNNGQMYCITDTKTLMKNGVKYVSKSTEIAEPDVTIDTYIYDGTAQGPTIVSRDAEHTTVTNATATDAGTYTMTIALNNTATMMWEDGTTLDRHYEYTIEKASQSLTVDKNSLSLDNNKVDDTITVTCTGDGVISAVSSDPIIATTSINGNEVIVTAHKQGEATITIKLLESNNYNESSSVTVDVTAVFYEFAQWNSGTDEEIVSLINLADRGVIDLYEDAGWRVGDERVVHLTAMDAVETNESHVAQDVTLVLLDRSNIDAYTYINPIENGRISCSFIVGIKDCLIEKGKQVKSSENVATWENLPRRAWCNNTFYNAIPSSLRSIFKQVKVKSTKYPANTSSRQLEETNDYIFLASAVEVLGSGAPNLAECDVYSQFDYYKTNANKAKHLGSNGSITAWWTRSVSFQNITPPSQSLVDITTNAQYGGFGQYSFDNSYYEFGIAPIGCI